jgi:hypothetical protein
MNSDKEGREALLVTNRFADFPTPGQVCPLISMEHFHGASGDRGLLHWDPSPPEAEAEQVGWRSCLPVGGRALRHSADWRCWPSTACVLLLLSRPPCHAEPADAPAASPMTCRAPSLVIREALRPAVADTAHPCGGSPASWTRVRRGRGHPVTAFPGRGHLRPGPCAAPTPARSSRARQRSLRHSRDASCLLILYCSSR